MQRLHDTLYVSAQIQPEDLPALQQAGIAQIICHRPDGESADQPDFATIAAAAAAHNLRALHIPVAGSFPEAAVQATQQALDSGLPTLMYCRTGTRSTILWAIGEARQGRSADELLRSAAAIGYDLHAVAGLLTPTA